MGRAVGIHRLRDPTSVWARRTQAADLDIVHLLPFHEPVPDVDLAEEPDSGRCDQRPSPTGMGVSYRRGIARTATGASCRPRTRVEAIVETRLEAVARYYSDEVRGPRPRVGEDFDRGSWGGVFALMEAGIRRPLFAHDFPLMCEDGKGPYGCDEDNFLRALGAEVPDFAGGLTPYEVPETLAILDLLQFMFRHASAATVRDHHRYFGHDHLRFDRKEGRRQICEQVNSLLARNGLAYELGADGEIRHISAPVVRELVRFALPSTGDAHIDRLLETARVKFTDRDPAVRREALEQAWDAFERFKTLLDPDKKRGAAALIKAAASSAEEAKVIEAEMRTLTKIGNDFQIRHHEVGKTAIGRASAEYLFARMYALLHRLHPLARTP
jgi:hypothetical protein